MGFRGGILMVKIPWMEVELQRDFGSGDCRIYGRIFICSKGQFLCG